MPTTYQKQAKLKLITTLISVVVVAGIVVVIDHLQAKSSSAASSLVRASSNNAPTTQSPTSSSTGLGTTQAQTNSSNSVNSSTGTSSSGYKDGTFIASSSYYVPHGNENIQVSLTINSGVITNVSIQNSEGDHTSARYQEDFNAVYKNYVVGKKISGLQLSVVSGASDTTQGFNDALSQITSKAQA